MNGMEEFVTRTGRLVRHHVQNPLQVILAEIELLRSSPSPEPELVEGLATIDSAARRIAQTVSTFDQWALDGLSAGSNGTGEPVASSGSPPGVTGSRLPETGSRSAPEGLAAELARELRLIRHHGTREVRLSPRRLAAHLGRATRLTRIWEDAAVALADAPGLTRSGDPVHSAPVTVAAPEPAPAAAPASAAEPSAATIPSSAPAAAPDPAPAAEPGASSEPGDDRGVDDWRAAAHELRNATQALTGWLDTVRVAAAGRPEWLAPLERSARAVVSRAEELLGGTRQTPQPTPRRAPIASLAHAATVAVERMRPAFRDAGVSATVVSGPETETLAVEGAEERLVQVVLNLLRNALRVSPRGSVVVVSSRGEDDAAILEVEDRGPGLTTEQRSRLFTDAEGSGGGVGLAVSGRIAVELGGTLEAAPATPGRGARFVLRLPRVLQ